MEESRSIGGSAECLLNQATSQPSAAPPSPTFTIIELPGAARDPPCAPTIQYWYLKKGSESIHPIIGVVMGSERESAVEGKFMCKSQADGFLQLDLTIQELEAHFVKLEIENVLPNDSSEKGQHLSLADLKNKWQVGSGVRFRHYDVMSPGLVAGRFLWKGRPSSTNGDTTLSLVLLLRTFTNELLLSHEVTDLEIADGKAMVSTRDKVFIQGMGVLAIVAALVASVTYPPMIDPPKGIKDILGVLPVLFMLLNAIAFYCSVLPLVVMIAFIPSFGTPRQWEAIFFSGFGPFVVGFINFYISFIISPWVTMGSSGKSVAVTVLGCFMVVGVYLWAIRLMNKHMEQDLRIQPYQTAWDWYVKRTGKPPCALSVVCRFVYLLKTSKPHERNMASVMRAIRMTRQAQQQAHILGEFSHLRNIATSA